MRCGEYAEPLLERGISFIVLSGGALCDDALRDRLERAAAQHRALLYVPSGGIGGLDALKAVCVAGADEVSIAVTKPPAAWKEIPYVEKLGVDLDRLAGPRVLFEGSAREGVPHFPGQREHRRGAVDGRHRLRPHAAEGGRRSGAEVQHALHRHPRAGPGAIDLKFESVAMPDNPKTSMLACFRRSRGDPRARPPRALRHLAAHQEALPVRDCRGGSIGRFSITSTLS